MFSQEELFKVKVRRRRGGCLPSLSVSSPRVGQSQVGGGGRGEGKVGNERTGHFALNALGNGENGRENEQNTGSGVWCVYTMFLVKDLYNNRALDDLLMKLQIFFISF